MGTWFFLLTLSWGEGSKCWLSGRAVPPSVLEPAAVPLPKGPVSLFTGNKGPVAGWSPLIKSRGPGMLEESCGVGTHLAGGAHPSPRRGCHPHPVPCPRQAAFQKVESSSLERADPPDPGPPRPPQACGLRTHSQGPLLARRFPKHQDSLKSGSVLGLPLLSPSRNSPGGRWQPSLSTPVWGEHREVRFSRHHRVLWDPKGCVTPAPQPPPGPQGGCVVEKPGLGSQAWVQTLTVSFPSCELGQRL